MSRGTNFPQMLKLAQRNVLRNWRHSLATIFAIAAGFAAVSLFDGFIHEIEWQNRDGYSHRGMLADVLIQRKGAQENLAEDFWSYVLTAKEQQLIDTFLKDDPDFLRRIRFLEISGLVNSGKNNAVFLGAGFEVDEGAKVRGERWAWNTVAGMPLHLSPPNSIVVGQGLGRMLDCESDFHGKFTRLEGGYVPENRPFTCRRDRLSLSATTEFAQVNSIDLKLSGLIDGAFREADNRVLYVPLAQAQKLLDTDKITLMSVELKDSSHGQAFISRLQNYAKEHQMQLDAMPWVEHNMGEMVRSIEQVLHVFRNIFMTIVVIIGVMSIANTMMKSVNERVREIGTLRSIGFLQRDIVVMFTAEGFLISLLACGLGFIVTLVTTLIVSVAGISYKAGLLSMPIALKIKPAPQAWILSLLLLSILASGTAWFCSRRASKMIVADAMRHV